VSGEKQNSFIVTLMHLIKGPYLVKSCCFKT